MIRNIYLIVVVLFRTLGVCAAGVAVLWLIAAVVFSRSSAVIAFMFSSGPLLVGGALPWFVAKPAAKLITSDLEE